MSIRRNYADCTTTFTCDECGEIFEADGLDFEDAYDEYQSHGGRARMIGGDWEHRCECCE